MQEIFMLVGRIMQSAQFVEWNIALVVRLHLLLSSNRRSSMAEVEKEAKQMQEDMQKMTMGEVIETLRSVRSVSERELSMLKRALYDRNYIAHAYFKEKDFATFGYGQIAKERQYLTGVLTNMNALNDGLCALIKRQKYSLGI